MTGGASRADGYAARGAEREETRAAGFCVLAAAALVPWTFSPALLDSFVLPKLLVAAALAAAAAGLAGWEGRFVWTPLHAPLAALLILAALSGARAPDPLPNFLGSRVFYAWSLLGWLPCLLLAQAAAEEAPGFRGRLALALAWGSIPVSAYAIGQVAGLDPIFRPDQLPSGGRAVSSFGSPIALGCYLCAVAPAALHAARVGRPRGVGLAAAALAAAALCLSGTRAAWLSALAGCAVYVWLAPGAAGSDPLAPGRGLLAPGRGRRWFLALAAACALVALATGRLAGRRAGSDLQRVETWKAAVRIWKGSPLLGVGPEGFDFAFRAAQSPEYAQATDGKSTQEDAHNDWLQVLATLGLAGALAYAWLHWRVWRVVRGAIGAPDGGDGAALAGGLASLFLFAKVSTPTWGGAFVAALLAGGLASSQARGARKGLGRAAALAGAALGAAAFAAASWLAVADGLVRLGRRARAQGSPREAAVRLEAACGLRPAETLYRLELDNLLWDVASAAPGPEKAVLLQRATEVAAEGVARRPEDPDAWHLLGLALLRRAEWAGEPTAAGAMRALARGLELEPFSRPIVTDAVRAARLAGDEAQARELERRLLPDDKKR